MHEALSVIMKKFIAQNLPYFYQNSLKIFINLTDCWKKYGNYVMLYTKQKLSFFLHIIPQPCPCPESTTVMQFSFHGLLLLRETF